MYANGSNGRWEPLVEPAELTLATEHNRRTKDYQLELSSAVRYCHRTAEHHNASYTARVSRCRRL